MAERCVIWLVSEQIKLFSVTPDHILHLLYAQVTGRGKGDKDIMVSTIRARHVRLLERVYRHLEVAPSPASMGGA